MKKQIIVIGSIFLLLITWFPLSVFQGSSADPNTYYVDDNYTPGSGGWGTIHFNTIQWAIDTVPEGNLEYTIRVYPGTYHENIKINQTIRLFGEDKNTTIIDADGGGYGINISGKTQNSANNVIVSSFTIQNAATAVHLQYIPFQTSSNTITNLIIKECDIGIHIEFSEDNTISQNSITTCDIGMFLNIYASSNQLTNNVIAQSGTGIVLDNFSVSNSITDNIFSNNDIGVRIGNSYSEGTNSIYHNDFLDSITENAYDPFKNVWDDNSLGNHWSNFDEPSERAWDNNSDGIVDSAYFIPLNNYDNYPSVDPLLELPLTITAPVSVQENQPFQVTIGSIGDAVEGATVTFNSETKTTNSQGQVSFTAPSVPRNIVYSIVVSKTGYEHTSASITVVDTSSPPPEPQLVIQAPSSVLEGTPFQVTITADQIPISSVSVGFEGAEYTTNTTGQVTFIAPQVDEDTTMMIKASKYGYQSASGSIIITDSQSHPGPGGTTAMGWVYGWIMTTVGEPVSDVSICALQSGETIACTITNTTGWYRITLPSGLYLLKATKQDYVTNIIYDVQVLENTGTNINFTLRSQPTTTEEQTPIDYALRWGTETGAVLGQIDVLPAQETISTLITTYSEHIDISIQHANTTSLGFLIGGPEEAGGKILAVRFGSGTFSDLKNITVLYDYESIPFVTFDDIFHQVPEETTTAEWTSVIALDKNNQSILYVLIWIPQFSQHSIIIYSPQQIIQDLWMTAIILYGVVITILGIVIAAPLIRLWRKIE